MEAHRVLTRVFGIPEEINGADRCLTYLYRWVLHRNRFFKVYLHHFVADDWSLDLHDHPKRFISIGLKGGYIERTPGYDPTDRTCDRQTVYTAPWARSFPAEHIHRLEMFRTHPTGSVQDCWTLVIVLKTVREWGFWHLGKFINWRDYVRGKDGIADQMRACE